MERKQELERNLRNLTNVLFAEPDSDIRRSVQGAGAIARDNSAVSASAAAPSLAAKGRRIEKEAVLEEET